MTDYVMIPAPDGWIRLSTDAYRDALKSARDAGYGEMSAPRAAGEGTQDVEGLVSAQELGRVLGLSTTWVAKAGRDGVIPRVMAGRYPRFSVNAVKTRLDELSRQRISKNGKGGRYV